MITSPEYAQLLIQAHALRAALEEFTRSDMHSFWMRSTARHALVKCGELPALPPEPAPLLQLPR